MKKALYEAIEARIKAYGGKRKSAWNKGVIAYALELFNELDDAIECGWFDEENLKAPKILEKQLLNGAEDWREYSWGGCSLIYDYDIAERLSNPTELKATKNGKRKPNKNEEWLDTQARALYQASRIVKNVILDEVNK